MGITEISSDDLELVLDAGAELGEGPVWDDRASVLWWVDIKGERVHRFDPADGSDVGWDVGGQVGSLALREREPGVVLAMPGGFSILDTETGAVTERLPIEADLPGNRMNDGLCDARGRFWAGTMATGPSREPAGSLYRLDPDWTATRVLDGIRTSNGIDWSNDGRTMYFADTPTQRIDAFDVDPEAGTLSNRRTVLTIPREEGGPDGMILDAEDHLWIALWGGDQLRRYTPDGEPDTIVHVPAHRVTKCAFGGLDLQDIYITCAWLGDERERYPKAGGVFRCRTGVRGRPTTRFAG